MFELVVIIGIIGICHYLEKNNDTLKEIRDNSVEPDYELEADKKWDKEHKPAEIIKPVKKYKSGKFSWD